MQTPIEIDVWQLQELRSDCGEYVLLDCREPVECGIVAFPEARQIPMGELPRRLLELAPYREQRIIVHCHHGVRSLMVTEWLRQQGFALAQNLVGGIDAWSVLIDADFPRY